MLDRSDFGELSAVALTPAEMGLNIIRPSIMYQCRKWLETLIILFGLIGGGTGLGYYFGIQQNQVTHLAEMDRLRDVYQVNLYQITKNVKSAANSIEVAATQLDDAANVTSQTANRMDKVSKQVFKPQPNLVPKAPPTVMKPTVINPEVVKQSPTVTPTNPFSSR